MTVERNAAIAADYLAGVPQRELARRWGLTVPMVRGVLARQGALLPAEECRRRATEARRRASYANVGRKPATLGLPDHLHADVRALMREYPAAVARRKVLEALP